MRPLVISCDEHNAGIEIKHNTDALSIYLYHADKSTIENIYIANVEIICANHWIFVEEIRVNG